MRHCVPRVAIWIILCLVPEDEREPLVGDLLEEYALRVSATSATAARNWCLQQILVSAPHLLWTTISRSAWISTAGVALLAYIAVGAVELVVNWVFAVSSAHASIEYSPFGLLITFPMVVFIGYFAGSIRRRAPILLGAMMLAVATLMTLSINERVPSWYRAAYFVAGPAAAIIGSLLRSRRRFRS